MFCEKCGTPNENNAKFCTSCGTPIQPDVTSHQPVAQQPVNQQYQQPVNQQYQQPVNQQYQQPVNQQYQQPVNQQYQQPVNQQGQYVGQPVYPQQYQQNNKSSASLYFKEFFGNFKTIFTKPVATTQNFAKSNNLKQVFGLFLLQAVVMIVAALVAALLKKVAGEGTYLSRIEYFSAIYSVFIPFVSSIFVSLFLVLFNSVIFKNKSTFSQMLSVSSTASFASIIFTAASIPLSFIFGLLDYDSIHYILNFFSAATTIGSCFLINSSLKSVSDISEEKRILTLIFAFLSTYICNQLFLNICIKLSNN